MRASSDPVTSVKRLPGGLRGIDLTMRRRQDPYADTGCSLAPSCLACSFERCRYDAEVPKVRRSHHFSRLEKEERAQEIIKLHSEGMRMEDLARKFDISRQTVGRILHREEASGR